MSGHRTARVLIYTHRWLGIALGALFVVWFISGVIMMYARMPELSNAERLARLPALNPASIRVAPPQGDINRLTIGTLEGRPIYRITGSDRTSIIFADTGDPAPGVDADQAMRLARVFEGGLHTLRYDSLLADADQWSFGIRSRMPVHRIAVDDPVGTELYVTESGGDVVLKTNASGRFWGWTGSVMHWLYFAPLRRHSALWNEIVIWVSIAGTILCVAGIAWGVWRWSPLRGYRLRRERFLSPYAGWMRWHHYSGLIFGVAAAAWVFSGLLSMDPWDWHPGTSPTSAQRLGVTGGPIEAAAIDVGQLRSAIQAFGSAMPKEIDVVRFRGAYYVTAPGGIVLLSDPQGGVRPLLPDSALADLATVAMPGVAVEHTEWLTRYDAYYYDRSGGLSLPVLRVKYADPQRTWLYFDPRRAAMVRKEERLTRLNRWLYHGLHSLDFPFLYYKRPLWDMVVIALNIGGLVLSATTLTASWRRVRRNRF